MGYNKGDIITAGEYNDLLNRLLKEIQRRSNAKFTNYNYNRTSDKNNYKNNLNEVNVSDVVNKINGNIKTDSNIINGVLQIQDKKDNNNIISFDVTANEIMKISDIVSILDKLEKVSDTDDNAIPSGKTSEYIGGGCKGACVGFCSQKCVNTNRGG